MLRPKWSSGGAATGVDAGPSASRLQKRNRSAQDDRVSVNQREAGSSLGSEWKCRSKGKGKGEGKG
jgi:hypothetical protein